MTRRLFGFALAFAFLASSAAFSQTVLRITDDPRDPSHKTKVFSLSTPDNPTPTPVFLVGIAYFSAVSIEDDAKLIADLEFAEHHGMNWIRVWADLNGFFEGVEPHQDFSVFNTIDTKYMDRLKHVIEECDKRGIVVDVSISTVVDYDDLKNKVQVLADSLKDYRNVYFDLWNEGFDDFYTNDQTTFTANSIHGLVEAVRNIDAERLCTMSDGSIGTDKEIADWFSQFKDTGLHFVSLHPVRQDTEWSKGDRLSTVIDSYNRQMDLCNKRVPILIQEPLRVDYMDHPDPYYYDFYRDVTSTKLLNVAGWLYHNAHRWVDPYIHYRPFRSNYMALDSLLEQFTALADPQSEMSKELREKHIPDYSELRELDVWENASSMAGGPSRHVWMLHPEFPRQIAHDIGGTDVAGGYLSANSDLPACSNSSGEICGDLTNGTPTYYLPEGDYVAVWRTDTTTKPLIPDGALHAALHLQVLMGSEVLGEKHVTYEEMAQSDETTTVVPFVSHGGNIGFRTGWGRIPGQFSDVRLDFIRVEGLTSEVTVVAPNGSEQWPVGETHPIQWYSASAGTNVELQYLADDGNWKPISASNGELYEWTVPTDAANSCFIRIGYTDSNGRFVVFDQSDAAFSTQAPPPPPSRVVILEPASGQRLVQSEAFTIRWDNKNDFTGYARVYLCRYNTCTDIRNNVWVGNWDRTYPWSVGQVLSGLARPGFDYEIRMAERSTGKILGKSGTFTILSTTPSLSQGLLNGGETVRVGEQTRLTWSSKGIDPNELVKFEISRTGNDWTEIGQTRVLDGFPWAIIDPASRNGFLWTATGPATATGKIRVSLVSNPSVFDESDGNFTVQPQPSKVTVTIDVRTGHGFILPEWTYYKVLSVDSGSNLTVETRPERDQGYVGDFYDVFGSNGGRFNYPSDNRIVLNNVNQNTTVVVYFRLPW